MKKKSPDLSKENVIHLSKLSKLDLTDDEQKKILQQLNDTLHYVENLHELPTDSVSSKSAHVTKTTNVFSEDVVDKKRILPPDEALQNALVKKKNYFVVKRIL